MRNSPIIRTLLLSIVNLALLAAVILLVRPLTVFLLDDVEAHKMGVRLRELDIDHLNKENGLLQDMLERRQNLETVTVHELRDWIQAQAGKGLSIDSLAQDGSATQAGAPVQLKIKVDGSYVAITKWMQQMETSFDNVSIERIQLKPVGRTRIDAVCTVLLEAFDE